MTELIPGKRYRFTGVVTAGDDSTLNFDWGVYDAFEIDADPEITVELLPDPLPTTPGSVVMSEDGEVWQLRSSGDGRDWRGTNGAYRNPQQLANQAGLFRVLHVADKPVLYVADKATL